MKPEILNAWLQASGGRRFFMTMGASVIGTLLFVAHYLSENGFLTLIFYTVTAYITGNTVEAVKSNVSPKP